MQYGFFLLIIGLLALSGTTLYKKFNVEDWVEYITPYKGWVGVGALVYGIFGILSVLGSFGLLSLGTPGVISFVLLVASVVVMIALGFILGYDLVAQYVLSKNPTAKQKGEAFMAKISGFQHLLGYIAVVIGVLSIVLYFLARYVLRFMM